MLQAIRKRKALFRTLRRSGNSLDLAKYKTQWNHVVAMLRECKEEFFQKLNSANVKDFWKTIRMLNKKETTIPTLCGSDIPVDSSQGKATLLNNFFYSCFNQHCPQLSTSHSPLHTNLGSQDYPSCLLCSEDLIANLLVNLDISMSSGTDGISARMLKSSALSIAPSLTKLFNLFLTTGIFPSEYS